MGWLHIQNWSAASLLLPSIVLALKQKTPFHRRDELLWATAVITVVSLVVTGERDVRRIMKVIVPQCVQPEAASLGCTQQPNILRLILADENCSASAGRFTHALSDGRKNMFGGGVKDLLSRIKEGT